MPTRNVFLTEHFDSFIASGVESGQFTDASEVVREGLRLLEQRQQEDKAKIDWLHGAIQEGVDEIERGEGSAFASIDDLADEIRVIGEEASQELAAGSTRG